MAIDSQGEFFAHRAGTIGEIRVDGVGTIPIYENPKIREARKAGYSRTNIFKRNEPIRLWTGSTARSIDVEIKYTMPHMVALGGTGTVRRAVQVARDSVKGQGRKGPGYARLRIGRITYPPCIVTEYEFEMSYEHGSYKGDSRVIILRLKMEEYHGWSG